MMKAMKRTGFNTAGKKPQILNNNSQSWRRRAGAFAVFAFIGLALTVFAWRGEAAPPAVALPEPAATPKAQPAAEVNEGFFSLTANRTYGTANSPRVWLDYRNLGEIDFRVYRLQDPAKFFRTLENKHQMGEEEKDEAAGKLSAPSIMEAMRSFKDNIFRKVRNFVREQIDWETRRDLNRYIDRKGDAVRRPLNVADYARVPLLNPGQMVSSWRERLPEKVDEYDRRMVPLGKREPGVYLVEAVSGGLRAYTVAIVSDLVMVNKTSPRGEVFVHAIHRKTGAARNGATVEVVKNKQVVANGATDGNGNFSSSIPQAKPTPPPRNSVSEEKRDDYLVMATENGHFAISDLYQFSYQDEEDKSDVNLRGYIYTDRPVYRPGHKVSFKGILRDLRPDGYALLAQKTVSVTIEDGDNTKLLTRAFPLTPRGTFSGELLLPAAAKLGGYSITANAGGASTNGYFEVDEYKKPEYKVAVTAPQKFIKVGEKTRFQVEAKYFFGAPVANAEVKYYVYRSRYYPNWWSDGDQEIEGEGESPDQYNDDYSYNSETVKEGTGTTDAQGRLFVDFDVPQPDAKQGGYDFQYKLEANVTDSARRAIESSGSFVAIRSNIKASVTASRWIVKQGETTRLVVRASDFEGKPVAAPVRLQFVERTWEKVKKKYDDGTEYDSYATKDKDLNSVNVTTSAQGETVYEYTPDRAGSIIIKSFVIDNGKEIESLGEYLWVSGRDESYTYSYPNYGSITMIPDKKSYQPGETAKVLVMLPTENANLFVTTELLNVMSARNVQVKGRSVVIDVPIEAKYAPNIFLNISYVQDNELYTDDQMLAVPAREKTLDVTLIPDKKEYQPRETVTYQVVARNSDGSPATGAEISVGVVDEAIYSIRGDYDNIKREFYGRRYNEVETNFTTSFYFEGYAGAKPATIAQNGKRPNNLADFKNEQLVEPTVRKNFKDTAFWQPAVITGADGTAKVAVKLPDNLTTWRATARAITADTKVGQTVTRVLARKGVIIRLATPRFVTAGDTVTLSGIVHNYLGADKRAQVSLTVTGGGQILDNATQSVTVLKNGEQRIDWRVSAPQQSGELVLLAKALTDTESDAVQIPLPVQPRGLRQSNSAAGIFSEDNAQQEYNLDIPADADATARTLRIEAAPSVAASLFGALDYLTGYPYGCVEQTMSRFLPTVIVAQALKDVKSAKLEDKDKLKDKVDKGLERLYNMQHDDGGWGWWKNDETDPFMTAYVVDGLKQAELAGFDIDNTRLTRARVKLKELLGVAITNDQFDVVYRANTRAYMVYAYVISGDSDAAIVNELVAQEDSLTHYGRALLALALHHRKDARAAQLAEKIAQKAVSDKQGTETAWQRNWTDYRKQQRTEPDVESTALSLKALSRITPNNPLLPKVARWLVTHRKFGYYWDSTKATAFAISGLTDYLKASQELTPDYTVEIYVNGALVQTQRATAANAATPFVYELKGANLAATNRVRVVKKGRGNLYLTAGLDYYAGNGDVAAAGENGLQLTREYLRLTLQEANGKYTWKLDPLTGEVKTGDLLVSRLHAKGMAGQYMMIEDPIPAGAEQLYTVGGLNLDYSERNWSDWYSSREFRDNRTVYFLRWFDGDATFQYALRVINPGDFRLVPARAEFMYDPDVKANSESGAVRFADK